MSDKPGSIIDDPNARAVIVGSVSFEGPQSLADGITWLLGSPDLKDGDGRYDVELRMEKAANAGVAELVLFVGKGASEKEESAFAIIVASKSRQGR